MAIQILPGLDQYLRPGIEKLGETISLFTETDRRTVRSLRNAMLERPDMIQHFVDLEKSNPGTLKKMGFGPLADMLGGMQESVQSEVARETRGDVVRGAKATAKGQATKAEITSSGLEQAAALLVKNAGLSEDYARRLLELPTRTQERTQEAGARVAEVQADVAEAGKEASVLESLLKQDRLKNAITTIEGIGEVDVAKVARDIVQGNTVDPNTVAGLFSSPDTAKLLTELIATFRNQDAQEHAKSLAELRADAAGITPTSVFNRAYDVWKRTGKGSVTAYQEILTNPAAAFQKAQEIAKKPTRDQTIEERLFLESVEAYQNEEQNVRMDRIRELISGMSRIRSDMERQLALIPSTAGKIQSAGFFLQQMNDLLLQHQTFGGPAIIAKYGKIPGSNKGLFGIPKTHDVGLYFVDANDNVFTPEEVQTQLIAAATTESAPEDQINRMIAYLEGLSEEERQKQIKQLEGTPAYEQIKAHFDRRGK